MNPDDVRMVAGIAASLVASVGVVGLAVLGAYLIATDHRREESMRQHQRAMRSLGEAHRNVRSSGPVRPHPELRTPLDEPARRATSGTGRTSGLSAAPSRRGHRRNRS